MDFDTGDSKTTGLKPIGFSGTDLYAQATWKITKTYPDRRGTVSIALRWQSKTKYYAGQMAGITSANGYESPGIIENAWQTYIASPEPGQPEQAFPQENGVFTGQAFTTALAVYGSRLRFWHNGSQALTVVDDSIAGEEEVVFEATKVKGSLDDLLIRRYMEPEPFVWRLAEENKNFPPSESLAGRLNKKGSIPTPFFLLTSPRHRYSEDGFTLPSVAGIVAPRPDEQW